MVMYLVIGFYLVLIYFAKSKYQSFTLWNKAKRRNILPYSTKNGFLQSPFILTALLDVDLINVVHVPLSGHHVVVLFECRRQCYWIDTKLDNDVIIPSLKSESICTLINRIPGSSLLISSLPSYQAWLWECMLNRSASPTMSTNILKALPGKLDIIRHSPSILYIRQASRCQQAFSKPCLVNLISKDTHLVFSIFGKLRDINKRSQSLAW